MPRIPYAKLGAAELKPLTDRIIAERGEVLDLYRMLLHSPPVAEGWLSLLTAVRHNTSLPARLRELIIVRIAHLNGANYEAEQHTPIALAAGATRQQLDVLAEAKCPTDLFDEWECAALALTDQITRQVQIDESVWQSARSLWSDREIVELVVTISAYNMVSRFLEALDIHAN
jgi:AhpD family alkylhydroperoxidase